MNKKRLISLTTALVLCLSAAACSKKAQETVTNEEDAANESEITSDIEEVKENEEVEEVEESEEVEEVEETEETSEEEPSEEQTEEKTEDVEEELSPTPLAPVAPVIPEKEEAPEKVEIPAELPGKKEETSAEPIAPIEPEAPAEVETPAEPETNENEVVIMNNMRTEYNEYNNYRAPLTHTYKKLTEDKELTVVYFGGSVTAGHGSSDREKYSWRALIGKWMDESFPDAKIKHINRAVGESGTYLGTHRVQLDVIGPEPDLVFLEYSINDKYYGSTYEKASSQYETIVREIKKALPHTDIVTILVTDSGCFLTNKMGNLHTQAQAHEDMAQKYNIPTLHVGRLLSKVANYSDAEWKPKYAIDIVHLTDEGNKVYYDCIEEFMYNSLFCTDFSNLEDTPAQLIPVVSEALFDGDRQHIQPKKDILNASVELGGVGVTSTLDLYTGTSYSRGTFTLDSTDDIFAFKFNGTEMALWCNYYREDIYYVSIDGGDYIKKTGSSHAPAIVVEHLEPGEHVIRIKIALADKPLKIGSIFTRDESKATKKGEY